MLRGRTHCLITKCDSCLCSFSLCVFHSFSFIFKFKSFHSYIMNNDHMQFLLGANTLNPWNTRHHIDIPHCIDNVLYEKMKSIKDFHATWILSESAGDILLSGYIREWFAMNIPSDIVNLCLSCYEKELCCIAYFSCWLLLVPYL